MISNRIAQKSGLKRGPAPSVGNGLDLVVPEARVLRELEAAITFSETEFAASLSGMALLPKTFGPLCTEAGTVAWTDYSLTLGALRSAPFFKAGDDLIVPIPSLLGNGLRLRILNFAYELKREFHLLHTYREVIWAEMVELLGLFGCDPVLASLPEPLPARFKEGLFSLDRDKIIYVLLVTDGFGDYSGISRPVHELTEPEFVDIGPRVCEVVPHIKCLDPLIDRVLILTLCSSLAREVLVNVENLQDDSLFLNMPASDLRSIAMDSPDYLDLWRYAKDFERIQGEFDREITKLSGGTAGVNFRVSNSNLPSDIVIQTDYALRRRKASSEQNPHFVPSYRGRGLIEVRAHREVSIPISRPVILTEKKVPLVVEGMYGPPVWVIGPERVEEGLVETVRILVEMVAHWLWLFETQLAPAIAELSQNGTMFLVRLELSDTSQWSEDQAGIIAYHGESHHEISFQMGRESGMRLVLRPSLLALLRGPDNQGERELIGGLFAHIRKVLRCNSRMRTVLSDIAVQEVIDLKMPLGPKKGFTVLPSDSGEGPGIAEGPLVRKVQEWEFEEILVGVGECIRSKGRPVGQLELVEEKKSVINWAVEYLCSEIEDLIEAVRPDELLPFLIAHQEARTEESWLRQFTEPLKVAWSEEQEFALETLADSARMRGEANLANRIVIEFAVARPPRGTRHFSLEIYDRLMALAFKIISWGMYSDLLHYDLANIAVEILPSGRLEFDQRSNVTSLNKYMLAHLRNSGKKESDRFSSQWRESDEEKIGLENRIIELDRVFPDEFGVTFSELRLFLQEICLEGEEQAGLAKMLRIEDLVLMLSDSLDWSEEKVRSVLQFMTMTSREDFFSPKEGRAADVYPWRFNRALSCLRRPLFLVTYGHSAWIMWGNRHVRHALDYLYNLCVTGRIKVKSGPFKNSVVSWRQEAAAEFQSTVRKQIEEITSFPARCAVQKIGKRKLEKCGLPLGDIDVLGAIPHARIILAIECKDLSFARSPAEIRNQLDDLLGKNGSGMSTVGKHLKRVLWLEDNLKEVLQWLRLKKQGRWKVKPILVSNMEHFASYQGKIDFPVWSIETLGSMTSREIVKGLR